MKVILYLSFIVIIIKADRSADGLEYVSPPSSAQKFVPFPKIIWTSWDSGLDNAQIFTKLCLNNMNHFAKQSGFQLRFVTDQNYTQFLSPESNSRMEKILDPKHGFSRTKKSDILRAFLLYDNGGIWTDVHSYFVGNLSWVEKLYKVPGVYNRFFQNPNILFFTKNKDFSGNKTKIFDKQLQQQVYLFPGMEHWFVIAKKRTEFYKHFLEAVERYIKQGRPLILEESKKMGLQYGGELNGYFDTANFQLQYVLQKKQKELDAMKSPSTKYAVQYYKMWFMHSQSTGFILRKYLEPDQEIPFQFQFSKETLGRLYEFPVQPYFIKNVGWKATAINRILAKNGQNDNCMEVSNLMQPQSFIYTYLINITSMFKEVNNIKQTFSFFQQNCNPLAQSISKIKEGLFLIKKIIFGIFLSIPIVGLIGFILKRIKRGNYQRVKLNDY